MFFLGPILSSLATSVMFLKMPIAMAAFFPTRNASFQTIHVEHSCRLASAPVIRFVFSLVRLNIYDNNNG
jgi:hypothetical protein